MLECTNEPLMFSFCKAQMKTNGSFIGLFAYFFYLLLFLENLTHAVSYFSDFKT